MRTATIALAVLLATTFVSSVGATIIDFDRPVAYAPGNLLVGQPDAWSANTGTAPLSPVVVDTSAFTTGHGNAICYYTTADNQRGGYIGGVPVNTYNSATGTMQADFYFQNHTAMNLNVFGWIDLNGDGKYNANSEASAQFGFGGDNRFYIRAAAFGSDTGTQGALASDNTWYRITAYLDSGTKTVTLTAINLTTNLAVETKATGGNLTLANALSNGVPSAYTGTGVRMDIGTYSLGTYRVIDNIGGVNPIPEPSTLALLAAGLTGLLCYAWRKRK
jgi:hypothetical protein